MGEPRWVQHVSGQGKQYLVDGATGVSWRIKTEPNSDLLLYDLPKSEFVLCNPPERWVDVTEECEFGARWCGGHPKLVRNNTDIRTDGDGDNGSYRILKVQGKCLNSTDYAFIVEKREP